MGLYQVTFFFEGLQQASYGAGAQVGWSESWYMSVPGAIDSVFSHPDVLNYLKYRQLCLSANYRISFLRVTALSTVAGAPPLTKIETLQPLVGNIKDPAPSSVSGGSAQVQCAILIDLMRLPSGVNPERVHHKRFLIRGLSASIIEGNVLNVLSADWNAYVNFINFVGNKPTGSVHPPGVPTATALGIRYHDPAVSPVRLLTVINDPNSVFQIKVTPPPSNPAAGAKAVVRGITGLAGTLLNRNWNVVGNDLTGTTLGTTKKPLPAFAGNAYSGPGPAFITSYAPLSGTIDQYAIIGLRSKKTGSVFRRLRGRSSRKR